MAFDNPIHKDDEEMEETVAPSMDSLRSSLSRLIFQLGNAGFVEQSQGVREMALELGAFDRPGQFPGNRYFPELESRPIYHEDKPWFVELLEENADGIREEVESLQNQREHGFQQVNEKLYTGTWDQVFFYSNGRRIPSTAELFPFTSSVIDQIPEATSMTMGCTTFSWLQPGTVVVPHCGPTNARLRCHLGLRVPDGAKFRIGDEWTGWEEGKCLVFDDSFEHEVIHEGHESRVILLMDFWHPDVTEEQKKSLAPSNPFGGDMIKSSRDFLKKSSLQSIQLSESGQLNAEIEPHIAEIISKNLGKFNLEEISLDERGDFSVVSRDFGRIRMEPKS